MSDNDSETTYRDVNIGLANQFGKYAAANGIDATDFLAQSTPGEWGVALAEARTHNTSILEFELPEAVPFPLNPILSGSSTLVQSGCFDEECNITGIAVTPRADDPSRLRFLLARRLNLPGVGRTDQLIPLEQTWSKP